MATLCPFDQRVRFNVLLFSHLYVEKHSHMFAVFLFMFVFLFFLDEMFLSQSFLPNSLPAILLKLLTYMYLSIFQLRCPEIFSHQETFNRVIWYDFA